METVRRLLPVISRHCILVGNLDKYCLLCSAIVTNDLLDHVSSKNHKHKIGKSHYLKKYKTNFIKKVNDFYFCEVCNTTISTSVQVASHVKDEEHIKRKKPQLKREAGSIFFQGDKLIEDEAWHGYIEGTCVVCNIDIDDYSTHKYRPTHARNVVDSKVTVDSDDNIYRKIDGGYQCLTCNVVTSDTKIFVHLNSEEHKGAQISLGGNREYADSQKELREDVVYGDDTENRYNFVELPRKKVIPVSKELEAFVNQHGMYVTHDNFTIYCKICSSMLPGALNNVKEHIAGKKHQNSKIHWQHSEPYRMNMEKIVSKNYFTDTLIAVRGMSKYMIVNSSFCVEYYNFFSLKKLDKITCYVCEEEVPSPHDVFMHLISPSHVNGLQNAFVIASLKEELVRQINSQYQCVFCNTFTPSFGLMAYHLSTSEHKLQKLSSVTIFEKIKAESKRNDGAVQLYDFNINDFDIII